MAWPSTPLTTYVARRTPVIKADDLNYFQSGINGIINGTYSLAAVVVDGTGGNVVAPTAGTVQVSALASGTSTPQAAVPFGALYKDGVLFGGCKVISNAFQDGFNVKQVNALGAGVYQVIFNGAPTNYIRARAQVTSFANTPVAIISDVSQMSLSGSDLLATVHLFDAAGSPTDANFTIDVFGG